MKKLIKSNTSYTINSSTNLGPLSKFFKVAKPSDYDGLIADGPEEEEEYIEWINSQLAQDGAVFDGWAIAKARYHDALEDAALELAIIGKHSDGTLSLYWQASDHIYEINEYDVIDVLDKLNGRF